MNNRLCVAASLALALTACKPSAGGSGSTGSGPAACASGHLDLAKLSGDWIVSSTIEQPDGKVAGSQYRIRFENPPLADGTIKARLAWRLDSRPYTGKY